MVETVLAFTPFVTSYLGFSLLAVSQRSHFTAVSGAPQRAPLPALVQRRLRRAGGAALALGLALSWLLEGASFGSLLWVLTLGCAGVAMTFTLTWHPHWIRFVLRAFVRSARYAAGR